MSPAEYEPWAVVEKVDVPTPAFHAEGFEVVRLPYVAAGSAEAFATTSTVMALVNGSAIAAGVRASRVPQAPSGLEPPLARMRCDACDSEWDAWVTDDGDLEDPRDGFCATARCPRRGQPARPAG